MKTKILGLIALILTTVLAFSCRKDKVRYYKLTEIDYQMIPYKLGQTVNFVDSLGQSFVLTVIKDTITEGAIDTKYESIDRWLVSLKSELRNFWISLVIEEKWNFYKHISITTSTFNSYSFLISYDNEGKFVTDTTSSFDKQYNYDSLEINNKVYYDVVENIICKAHTSHENENKIPIGLLYNKTYGILQLADKDKVLFTIDN
ncbi:MAG: hypothetical protein LBN95_10970 [Prevotellaceae bacterium]|jgi:hypothetical protein|nr:hypothetical protein [Prevotellaceae bacterium]